MQERWCDFSSAVLNTCIILCMYIFQGKTSLPFIDDNSILVCWRCKEGKCFGDRVIYGEYSVHPRLSAPIVPPKARRESHPPTLPTVTKESPNYRIRRT